MRRRPPLQRRGPAQRRSPGRPHIPTWALTGAVIALLAGAALLFLRDGADTKRASSGAKATTSETPKVDSVLAIPQDTDTTTTATTAIDDEETPLPAVFATLRGVDIVLGPASGQPPDGFEARRVRVDGERLPCSGPTDLTQLAVELAVLDRTQHLLERAGASVTRLDGERGAVECVDTRLDAMEQAQFAVVVAATSSANSNVMAARPVARLAAAQAAGSRQLAAELGGALDAHVSTKPSPAQRVRLTAAGALDRADGSSSALVELSAATTPTPALLDTLAMQLASALAATAALQR